MYTVGGIYWWGSSFFHVYFSIHQKSQRILCLLLEVWWEAQTTSVDSINHFDTEGIISKTWLFSKQKLDSCLISRVIGSICRHTVTTSGVRSCTSGVRSWQWTERNQSPNVYCYSKHLELIFSQDSFPRKQRYKQVKWCKLKRTWTLK